jgi:hemerythrin-like metal-binding protein
MALFTWDDIYSVGHAQIDAQHKRLFDIANRFNAAYLQRAGRARLAQIFDELLDYTVTHFADEEALMRRQNYPEYASHKASHDKLVGLVSYYRQLLEAGAADIEDRVMQFIQTWLNGHILGTDRNYKAYLQPSAA